MTQPYPQYQQDGGQPPIQPKKKHTVRNVVLIVFAGMFLVIGGCTALIGGALSSVDDPAAVTSPVDNGPTPDPITTPTNHYTPTETVQPSPAPKATHKPAPSLTKSQEQAIGAAQSYLALDGFSRKGLIKQLSSQYGDGFSVKDATFAVDYLKINWNEQAARKAKSYLEMTHFSRAGLIKQLTSSYGEGFTHAQAVYGVNKAGL